MHGKKTQMIKTMNKKKAKDPNKRGKFRKTSKRDKTTEGTAKASKQPSSAAFPSTEPRTTIAMPGASKTPGPPWQVMGKRDAKQNVEAEIARRQRIRAGADPPSAAHFDFEESRKADVSGANRLVSATDRAMLGWKRFNPSVPSTLALVGAYLDRALPPSLGVPEVAFLGRSNVGKSSLLNRLVARAGGDQARVGKTPGATASVNLYALLGQPKRGGGDAQAQGGEAKPILGLADLPGFGYAKLSKDTKASVEEAAERYLGTRRELGLGVLLVDARRTPSEDDRAVLAALFDMGVPLLVAATKSDKLNKSEVEAAMDAIREGLGLPDGQPLRVSGVTGEGVKDLWRIILDACETRVEELREAMEDGRDDGGTMRAASYEGSEGDAFYDDVEEEEEGDGEDYEDGEDVYYDQGYDWVRGEASREGEAGPSDFYDGGDWVEDESEEDMPGEGARELGRESFQLKHLRRRVDEMERRGEI